MLFSRMREIPSTIALRVVEQPSAVDAAQWDACAPGAGLRPAILSCGPASQRRSRIRSRSAPAPAGSHEPLAEAEDGTLLGRRFALSEEPQPGRLASATMAGRAARKAPARRWLSQAPGHLPFTPVPGPACSSGPGPTQRGRSHAMIDMLAKMAGDNHNSSHPHYLPHRGRLEALRRARLAAAARASRSPGSNQRLRLPSTTFWRSWPPQAQGDPQGTRAAVRREDVTVRALLPRRDQARALGRLLHAFYMDTGEAANGARPTSPAPSPTSWCHHGRQVVLVMAEADGRAVGGALNLKGDDTLYGRYWGCLESHAFLHFEACYYQAIDYAHRPRSARVEAGAKGDHKIQRGLSAGADLLRPLIVDSGFRHAVDDYLKQERPASRAGDRRSDVSKARQFRKVNRARRPTSRS